MENTLLRINWHILWNENLTLQLSYDLVLGCSPFFPTAPDYDSSYPWIRLTFMHLMLVRPVQTYCWKKVWTSHLPSPTYNVIICQLFFALKRFIFQLLVQLCRGCFRRVRYDVLAFKNKNSVLSAKCLRKKYNKGCHHVWMSGRFGALRLLKQRC